MKKTDVFVILFIVFTSVFALNDLFLKGFYTSHDGPHQIVRAYYYHELLKEGQIPPRWVGGLNYGFGYPLFIFSYHMPWLIAELFYAIGLGVIDTVKMTFLLGFILSGLAMYFYQKSLFGRIPAFIGSLIYLYAPFRFSNIFVRASIGDATAFVFAPLLFWSFTLILKKITAGRIIAVGLSLTALILTHAMVAFFYAAAFALYIGYTLLIHKNKIKLIRSVIIALLLFISFSSFYLLPSLTERAYTKFKASLGSVSTNLNFVPFKNLIYSPWGYGTIDAYEGAMSVSVGIAQIIIAISALMFITVKMMSKKGFTLILRSGGLFYSGLFFISVYLMTPLSREFWLFISKYIVIDFNWRVLNLTVFSSSIIAGWLILNLTKKKIYQALFGIMLLIVAFFTNRNHLHINQSLDWDVPFFLKLEKTTNSFDEYMPRWTDNSQIKENIPRIAQSDDLTYTLRVQKNNLLELDVIAKKDTELKFNSLFYPGWTVYDNSIKREINPENGGLIEYPLKRGNHNIKLVFEKTPLRKYADMLTFVTLILSLIYLIKVRKNV